MNSTLIWELLIIAVCGAAGGCVNLFIGDSGFHLPKTEHGVWRPGYLGTIVIGLTAALGSWLTTNSVEIIAESTKLIPLTGGHLATALGIGFGGAKWWKSESEKNVYQKTAAIAAGKQGDAGAAGEIATQPAFAALQTALKMK